MKNLSLLQLILIIMIAFVGSAFQHDKPSAIIEGSVLAATTGKPLADVYLYIVAGEEETVTHADGRFTLKTWQAFPVRCTVEHKNYARQIVLIRQAGKIEVTLQHK